MPTPIFYPPLDNGLQKTLGSDLSSGITASLTLNNTNRIQNKPGVIVIDRIDTNGDLKAASAREYISYTGTSGNTLTGLTRGLGGSTDQDHSTGAVVEFVPDITIFNAVSEALSGLVNSSNVATLLVPTLAGNNTFAEDQNLASGKNITVAGADPYRTIVLLSGSLTPTTTAGCADVATVEAGTNDVDYKVLDFDQTSSENAFIGFVMPDSWDGGTLTATFVWTAASGTGTVTWGIKGRAFANDDAIDQAYGTAQTVTDTLITAADIHVSDPTSAITLAGSPAGGQWVQFKIYRDISDTLNADARLIAVKLEYKVGQYSD